MNTEIEQIKEILGKMLPKYGVQKAALFGSVVKGKATKESDIDLLVEFKGRKSLLDLAGLKTDLEELLEKKVDVLTYNSLHPLLKKKILSEQKKIL